MYSALLLLFVGLCSGQDGTVVNTNAGWVKGSLHPNHYEFLGIPFAAAPVGELRWKSPVPHERWNGVRDATKLV